MKSTKLVAILFLLFVTSGIFAQKVHYKDRYYTIVKSKIFHRGYDVYGQLSPGKIDTIHIIAKELYTEKGKLKEKYKKRKKRDRYKLPETFWEQREIASAEATNTTNNKVTATGIQIIEPESHVEATEKTTVKESDVATVNKSTTQKEESKGIEKEVAKPTNAATTHEEEKKRNEDIEKKKEQVEKEKVQQQEKKIEEKTARKAAKEDEMKEKVQQQKQDKKAAIAERKDEKNKRTQEKREKELAQKEQQQQKRASQQDQDEYKAKKETENIKNKDDKKLKNQKNKAEKSIAKEKSNQKKSAEKIEKKQAKERKDLKKKNKSLKKEKSAQLKNQKALATKTAASAITIADSKSDKFGTIYLKINKEKTSTTKNGDVLLFFDVINNSTKDLVLLKPNNSIDSRLDFFNNTMECEDVPLKSTDYMPKDLNIKDEDYITIPAKAKIELFINGSYRSWLSCNSDDIILQIQYNPFKSAEEGVELQPALKKQLNKSLKRITPIKIESENIKFKLNKQE